MKDKKSLKDIAEFVEKNAKDEIENFENKSEILEVKKLIEESSSPGKNDFTFTIGEVNAYLG
jgi:hypothetical protein